MALDKDEVATVLVGVCLPEMVVANLVEHRGALEAGDVPPRLGRLSIGPNHRCRRVPAQSAQNLPFEFAVTGVRRLLIAGMVFRYGVCAVLGGSTPAS